MQEVWIDEERCTLCGLCIAACELGLLAKEERSITVHDAHKCILCGHCKAICPQDAPQFSSGGRC